MMNIVNIYCDESCHLPNDREAVMVLGALWCPLSSTREIAKEIRAVKTRHGLSPQFEIKWAKVSPAKGQFYLDLVNYFFARDDLHFRALVVPDKSKLCHGQFDQDHDTWYYKMYFGLLKAILDPACQYRIYLDIKDTRSGDKIRKLHEVLCNNLYDFRRDIVERVQAVRSDEVEQIQLADLLLGAISYVNRNMTASIAKNLLVNQMKKRSGYSLIRSTLLQEKKCNIFVWQARGEGS